MPQNKARRKLIESVFPGMAKLPVQSVAILGYIEPVVSVLCSVVFLREPLGWYGWIGAALIIAAAISEAIPPKSLGKQKINN